MPESILYQSRQHPIIFFWPLLMVGIGYGCLYSTKLIEEIGIFISLIGLGFLLVTLISYLTATLTITTEQVIIRRGFFVRKQSIILRNKLESIDIIQSLIGKLFNYGNLTLTGSGGSADNFANLAHPNRCRQFLD